MFFETGKTTGISFIHAKKLKVILQLLNAANTPERLDLPGMAFHLLKGSNVMKMHNPLHPGEIINTILIEGANLNITDAAAHLGINRTTLSRLLNGHIGISAEMAVRLSKLLKNTDAVFWMNLQRDYDIWQVEKSSKKIHVVPLKKAA